jgi:hypothetical protein
VKEDHKGYLDNRVKLEVVAQLAHLGLLVCRERKGWLERKAMLALPATQDNGDLLVPLDH